MILCGKIVQDGNSLCMSETGVCSISQVKFKWEQCFVKMNGKPRT